MPQKWPGVDEKKWGEIRGAPASFGARSREHDRHRSPQDLQVKPERPVVDIFQIEPDPIPEIGNVVATANLPKTGQPGLYAQAPAMGHLIEAAHLIERQRPGTHQAHLEPKHVEQLWELVKTEFPQPA